MRFFAFCFMFSMVVHAYRYSVGIHGGRFYSEQRDIATHNSNFTGFGAMQIEVEKEEGSFVGVSFEAFYRKHVSFLYTYEMFRMKKDFGSQAIGPVTLDNNYEIRATVSSLHVNLYPVHGKVFLLYGGVGIGKGRGEATINRSVVFYDSAFIYTLSAGVVIRLNRIGFYGCYQERINDFDGETTGSDEVLRFDPGGRALNVGLRFYF